MMKTFKEHLAIIIVGIGITVVGLLAGVAIGHSDNKTKDAQDILSTVLPLVGTWVGTVIAYYFSKENLESATRSVTQLAQQLSPQERLKSTSVTSVMIPLANINRPAQNDDVTQLLTAIIQNPIQQYNVNRVPILTDNDLPKYVIHKSTIDSFQAQNPANIETSTLNDLLNDPKLGTIIRDSIFVVPENATLADAKEKMDRTANCQDVFVTKDGTYNSPVLGWITNVDLEKHSKV